MTLIIEAFILNKYHTFYYILNTDTNIYLAAVMW